MSDVPLPSIGTSSTVTVGLLITLLGVAFAAGISHFRLESHNERLEKLESKSDRSVEHDQSLVLRVQRLEDAVEGINKNLASINNKLDRALRLSKEER